MGLVPTLRKCLASYMPSIPHARTPNSCDVVGRAHPSRATRDGDCAKVGLVPTLRKCLASYMPEETNPMKKLNCKMKTVKCSLACIHAFSGRTPNSCDVVRLAHPSRRARDRGCAKVGLVPTLRKCLASYRTPSTQKSTLPLLFRGRGPRAR